MKTAITFLFLIIMHTQINAQIPSNWAQHTITDTINVPIERYWSLFFDIPLEKVAAERDYKGLPKIIKTTPVQGNFSKVGDSRRVHFDTGQTVLESIIQCDAPNTFSYELTEVEVDLRKVAHRARGTFQYEMLADGRTRIVWTYGFDQKNFLAKWLIKRYIRTTHHLWMTDTLAALKREIAALNNATKK